MTSNETERIKCQSRIAFKYEEDKNHDHTDNADVEIVKYFVYLCSVIISNGHYSQEIKRSLRLGSNGEVFKRKMCH